MKKLSLQYFITRFLMIFNIIFIFALLLFIIITSHHLLKLDLPLPIIEMIPKINITIITIAICLLIGNIILLFINTLYSSKQYFKVLEKLDFNDIHTSLNLLNNIKSVDDIGYLGQSITRLLEVYINYATIYKKRLSFEQAKLKILLENITKGAILVKKSYNTTQPNYIIHAINKKALSLLHLENAGQAIEQALSTFIHTNDQKRYIDTLISLNLAPLESNGKLNELKIETLQLNFFNDTSLKEGDKSNLLNVTILPFALQFYDDYRYRNPDNQNLVLDSFLVLLVSSYESSYLTNEPL